MKRSNPWKVRCEICEALYVPSKGYECDACKRTACASCTLRFEDSFLCDKCAHQLPPEKRAKLVKVHD